MPLGMPPFPSQVKPACVLYLLSIIIHTSSALSLTVPKAWSGRPSPSSCASTSALALASTNAPASKPIGKKSAASAMSLSALIDAAMINSAIDILEDQSLHRPGTPLDSILRQYMKDSSSNYDSEEKDALRDIVLSVARSQYRIDFKLEQIDLERTPENRVVAHIAVSGDSHGMVRKLMKSYKWLKRYKAESNNFDSAMDLQTRLECPDWAWPDLNDAFPVEEDLIYELNGLLRVPPLDLRVNTLKCQSSDARDETLSTIQAAGFHDHATATPWSPLGIRLSQRVPLETIPGLLDGLVEPQDEGSQLVVALMAALPGEAVADYCAGTGGKTLALAAQMRNKGRLHALDVDGARLERGRPRCAKAGAANVMRQVVQADMGRRDKWCKRRNRTFDRVLVDAPCSGVGSWRRKPDARRTWGGAGSDAAVDGGADRLRELLPLQQHILRRAARLVKPGGRLVYVTCSLLPEENERQIEEFLDCEEGGASGWRLDVPVDFVVPFEAGYLRLSPARHGTDGFFAAVLRRDEDG